MVKKVIKGSQVSQDLMGGREIRVNRVSQDLSLLTYLAEREKEAGLD